MTPRKGALPPLPEPLAVPVVDAHTHLDACGAQDADAVRAMVDKAAGVGVGQVVTVADDLASARWAAQASTWDSRVFAAVAVHPTRTATFTEQDKATLESLAAQPKVVAIGETGLDYHWDYSPRERQQDAFAWHIDLAKRVGKPLMIHDRDAHDDTLSILDKEGAPSTVVFHSFSGDVDLARRCVDAGYVLSFSGAVTFGNARTLREAAAFVPVEHMLVETDAPYLTPHPFRGRPNEPYCTVYTVRALADLRAVSDIELASSLRDNAIRVFGLDRSA
jgi:TatD DNase family protein